jgi:hypothetical protein
MLWKSSQKYCKEQLKCNFFLDEAKNATIVFSTYTAENSSLATGNFWKQPTKISKTRLLIHPFIGLW